MFGGGTKQPTPPGFPLAAFPPLQIHDPFPIDLTTAEDETPGTPARAGEKRSTCSPARNDMDAINSPPRKQSSLDESLTGVSFTCSLKLPRQQIDAILSHCGPEEMLRRVSFSPIADDELQQVATAEWANNSYARQALSILSSLTPTKAPITLIKMCKPPHRATLGTIGGLVGHANVDATKEPVCCIVTTCPLFNASGEQTFGSDSERDAHIRHFHDDVWSIGLDGPSQLRDWLGLHRCPNSPCDTMVFGRAALERHLPECPHDDVFGDSSVEGDDSPTDASSPPIDTIVQSVAGAPTATNDTKMDDATVTSDPQIARARQVCPAEKAAELEALISAGTTSPTHILLTAFEYAHAAVAPTPTNSLN